MSRRITRRDREHVYQSQAQAMVPGGDPFVLLGANYAWRASDATVSGGKTTSLVPYIGPLTLTRIMPALGQPAVIDSTAFPGNKAVPFDGIDANAGYTGPLSAVGSMTFVSVLRQEVPVAGLGNFQGFVTMTVGGAVNSGFAQMYEASGLLSARRAASVLATVPWTPPRSLVGITVFGATETRNYINNTTGPSTSTVVANAGDTLLLGSLAGNGSYTIKGEWITTAIWNRALTDAECQWLMRALVAQYGIDMGYRPVPAEILALAAGRPVFTADRFTLDLVTGRVRAFVDHNDPTHQLVQTTATAQVPIPMPHADFGGALCAAFSATSFNEYTSNKPAVADWMHDGTGGEFLMPLTPLTTTGIGTPVGTRNLSGRGFSFVYFATPPARADFYVLNAANAFVIQLQSPVSRFIANAPTYANAQFALADAPDATLRERGVVQASGNVLIPAEAGPSSATLRIGNDSGNWMSMRWPALWMGPAMTPAQRATVEQWVAQAYGVKTAAMLFQEVLALAAGRPVFTADNYIVDGVSGRVRAFVDWNDPTHQLVQTSAALQVPVPAPHADFGGALCASFTGAQAYQSNRGAGAWAFAHDGVSCERLDVFVPTSGSGGAANVVATTVIAGNNPGSQIYYTAGATIHHYLGSAGGAPVNAASIGNGPASVPTYTMARHEAAAANQYQLRQRRTLIGQGAFAFPPTPAAAQTPLTLGANGLPALQFPANVRWPACCFFPALSPAQRATVEAWLAQAYGITAP